jgi:hypothetical protein
MNSTHSFFSSKILKNIAMKKTEMPVFMQFAFSRGRQVTQNLASLQRQLKTRVTEHNFLI